MSEQPKKYEELDFTDDFMFCKILTHNLELCRELLEIILEQKIRKVELPEAQKAIKITYDGKGVRLDVYVEDEAVKIFINPHGKSECVPEELRNFLKYLCGEDAESDFIKRLEAEVDRAKMQKEWKVEYMTLLMRDQENIERGIELGKAEGRTEGLVYSIITLLNAKGSISENLQNQITAQKDIEILQSWLSLVAKLNSVEEFEKAIHK